MKEKELRMKKKKEEDKKIRREEKKKKKEELRKAGLLVSKEEKKKQKLAKEKLEQMRAQGLVVPTLDKAQKSAEAGQDQVHEEKGKVRRPVYGKKKKTPVPNQKEQNKDAAILSPKEGAAPNSAEPVTSTSLEKNRNSS